MTQQTPLAPWEQLPMYAVSDELAPRIAEFGLERNLDELRENGYTIIPVDRELTDRIRAATLRTVEGDVSPNASFDRACATPLGEDPCSARPAPTRPCWRWRSTSAGAGCVLSSVLATVRTAGSALGVHCDQSQVPSPFPEHLVLLTACWVTDEFTKENGATLMHSRHPAAPAPPEPDGARGGARARLPSSAPAGSVVLWDGAVWHGNYPRTTTGERVVLHVTYGRLAYQPVHDFSYLERRVPGERQPRAARTPRREPRIPHELPTRAHRRRPLHRHEPRRPPLTSPLHGILEVGRRARVPLRRRWSTSRADATERRS